jgi:DNA-directed RNA polymerase subunit E'/Rpb7
MLHSKTLDATINVRNPISFCADKARHLTIQLKNMYEGKCFKGAFIVSVDRVEHSSACKIVSSNNTAEGYVDVQFTATVAAFSRWDIVAGVTIMRTDQVLVGSTKRDGKYSYGDPRDARVVATLMPTPEAKTVRVGQVVCVRVLGATHEPMQPQVAVAGTLLTCDRTAPVYRVRGALDKASAAGLMPVVEAIDKELAARAVLVAERRPDLMLFEILLYSLSKPPGGLHGEADDLKLASAYGSATWTGPPTLKGVEPAKTFNVVDFVKKAAAGETQTVNELWSRPLALYRSSPLAAQLAAKGAPAPPGWDKAVDETPAVVLQIFLKGILDFLFAVRSMMGIYNTKDKMDEHHNIWLAMKKAQLPA